MKRIFLISSLILILSGCNIDPYENEKYGEMVIDSWFSYKEEDTDFGKVRRSVEDIAEITDIKCKFLDKDLYSKYVYSCKITYQEVGETIIPLTEEKTKNLYAVFMPQSDNTFKYKVYNSKEKDKVWEKDEEINWKNR